MRNKSLIVISLMAITSIACAQDWSIFYPGQYMFNSGFNVAIDSSRNDTLYMSKFISTNNESNLTFTHFGRQIVLGDSIDNLITGTDKIWDFEKKITPNNHWRALSDSEGIVTAHVDSIYLGDILGIQDSIKLVSLESTDSTYLWLTGKTFLWSKSHGLISTIDFDNPSKTPYTVYAISNKIITSPELSDLSNAPSNLEGTNIDNIGVQKITWESINDFEIYDEMHVKLDANGPDPNLEIIYYKYVVLDKIITDTLITYSIEVTENQTDWDDVIKEPVDIDTIFFNVKRDKYYAIDRIAGAPFFYMNGGMNYYSRSRSNEQKDKNLYWYGVQDSLFVEFIVGGCISSEYCLNGWYDNYLHPYCGIGSWRKEPLYYSGSRDFGSPHTFIITSMDEQLNRESFTLYPNPVRNTLHLMNESLSYTIRNISGSVLATGTGYNKEIDVSALNTGYYIIELRNTASVTMRRFEKL